MKSKPTSSALPQDGDWSKIGDGSVAVQVHEGPPTSEPPLNLDLSAAPNGFKKRETWPDGVSKGNEYAKTERTSACGVAVYHDPDMKTDIWCERLPW